MALVACGGNKDNSAPPADNQQSEPQAPADPAPASGGEITLTTKAPEGSVYYKGTIGKDRLVLDSRSEINGFEMSGCAYVFYPFED